VTGESSTAQQSVDRLPVLSRSQQLTLVGCVLFGASILLPVMRWSASAVFTTAGSARVFTGEAYSLVDGVYTGAALVPLSAAAVAVVAVSTLVSRLGDWVWWVQAGALVIAFYYPAWVSYVFVKKLDDPVAPAEGVVLLVLAFAAMGIGTWRSRPGRRSRVGVTAPLQSDPTAG
jgi:hypothetical protein